MYALQAAGIEGTMFINSYMKLLAQCMMSWQTDTTYFRQLAICYKRFYYPKWALIYRQ